MLTLRPQEDTEARTVAIGSVRSMPFDRIRIILNDPCAAEVIVETLRNGCGMNLELRPTRGRMPMHGLAGAAWLP
jgi:hypothetical protein